MNKSVGINSPETYGGPGQRSPDYSAFGQITGLYPCQLRAPSATWLAWQRAVQGVIPMFIVGLSVYALFQFDSSACLQRLRPYSPETFDRVLRTDSLI